MEGITITKRQLESQIKAVKDTIKIKEQLGKDTRYERELLKAWEEYAISPTIENKGC